MPQQDLDHLSRMGDAVQAYESRRTTLLIGAGLCGLALLAMLLLPRAPRDNWGSPVIIGGAVSPDQGSDQQRRSLSALARQLTPQERQEAASVLRSADPRKPASLMDAARRLPPDVRSSLLNAARSLSPQEREDAASSLAGGTPAVSH